MPHKHDEDELLLQEEKDRSRFVISPKAVKYKDIYDMGVKAEESFWTTSDVPLGSDVEDWEKLEESQKRFILHVLAFFAASDGIVIENLFTRFTREVQIPEVRYFYGIQAGIETIHAKMYGKLIDTYVSDRKQREELGWAVERLPSVKRKAEWALKYIESENASFAQRLLAFACVEGIFFSSSFAAIYYIKTKNLLRGLTLSNEYIARDEGMHTDFAVLLYTKYISHKLPQDEVHQLVSDAVDAEVMFVEDSLKYDMLGMNSELMSQYVRFVADFLLTNLGYDKLYNETNPFPFMENICTSTKSNFFERRVSEYKRAERVDDGNDDAFTFLDHM